MRSAQPLHPLRIIFCRLNYYYFLPTAALFDQEQREIKKIKNFISTYIYITACLFKGSRKFYLHQWQSRNILIFVI